MVGCHDCLVRSSQRAADDRGSRHDASTSATTYFSAPCPRPEQNPPEHCRNTNTAWVCLQRGHSLPPSHRAAQRWWCTAIPRQFGRQAKPPSSSLPLFPCHACPRRPTTNTTRFCPFPLVPSNKSVKHNLPRRRRSAAAQSRLSHSQRRTERWPSDRHMRAPRFCLAHIAGCSAAGPQRDECRRRSSRVESSRDDEMHTMFLQSWDQLSWEDPSPPWSWLPTVHKSAPCRSMLLLGLAARSHRRFSSPRIPIIINLTRTVAPPPARLASRQRPSLPT